MKLRLRKYFASLLALLFLSQTLSVAAMSCQMAAGSGEPAAMLDTPMLQAAELHGPNSHERNLREPMDHSAHHGASGPEATSADCCGQSSCAIGACAMPVVAQSLATSAVSSGAGAWALNDNLVSPRKLSDTPQRPPSA